MKDQKAVPTCALEDHPDPEKSQVEPALTLTALSTLNPLVNSRLSTPLTRKFSNDKHCIHCGPRALLVTSVTTRR
jgi:hypothetical protein